MTHEDSVALSQIVGAIKRARSTILSSAGQIQTIAKRNAGTSEEMLYTAGIKCLFSGLYWLDQAVETFGHVTRRADGRRNAKEAAHA